MLEGHEIIYRRDQEYTIARDDKIDVRPTGIDRLPAHLTEQGGQWGGRVRIIRDNRVVHTERFISRADAERRARKLANPSTELPTLDDSPIWSTR